MRRAVIVPNFGCAPSAFVELAVDLEDAGWDGLLVYDHLQFFASMDLEVMDPWVLLGAAAHATERLRLGTGVTPISRRRPWKCVPRGPRSGPPPPHRTAGPSSGRPGGTVSSAT